MNEIPIFVTLSPSKTRVVILRLASGLDPRGNGVSARDHLVVPDTPGNQLLNICSILVAEGMMVEVTEKVDHERADRCFEVTQAGRNQAVNRKFWKTQGRYIPTEDTPESRLRNTQDRAMAALLEMRECMGRENPVIDKTIHDVSALIAGARGC